MDKKSPNVQNTIREAYLHASVFLRECDVQDAAICAEMLLQHVMKWDRSTLLLHWETAFPQELTEDWRKLLERKACGEPVQYIIGTQEFYGLCFQVSPAVLIPRPETELLVEQIIKRGNELWPSGKPLLLDVGSGSGAIAVSIAVNCPRWRIVSTDISAAAQMIAQDNAQHNGVLAQIHFRQGDLLAPFLQGDEMKADNAIDILVANLPYIPSSDISGLQKEVREFEPNLALDGGVDGLVLYRRLIEQLVELHLIGRHPRLIGLEVGLGQTDEVFRMLKQLQAWERVELIYDLAGIARHVIAMN